MPYKLIFEGNSIALAIASNLDFVSDYSFDAGRTGLATPTTTTAARVASDVANIDVLTLIAKLQAPRNQDTTNNSSVYKTTLDGGYNFSFTIDYSPRGFISLENKRINSISILV
jgi:hypothetical protein